MAQRNYRATVAYILHNLILRYNAPGDLVLAQSDYPSEAGIHVSLRVIRVSPPDARLRMAVS